jgi:hypothetical protein
MLGRHVIETDLVDALEAEFFQPAPAGLLRRPVTGDADQPVALDMADLALPVGAADPHVLVVETEPGDGRHVASRRLPIAGPAVGKTGGRQAKMRFRPASPSRPPFPDLPVDLPC